MTLRWRPALVRIHRYVGLSIAAFLFLAGLTGAVLAFRDELDEALNPSAYRVETHGPALSPDHLAAAVAAEDPRLVVTYLSLSPAEGRASRVLVRGRDPVTGAPVAVAANWFAVDPTSGRILARRLWGECCFARLQIVPFLYELHHRLVLPGAVGVLLMGGVALFWVLDCFAGLALTLPRGRPFLAKWRPAFLVKGGSSFRLGFDLHRACGLWLWLVLLALAISSVAMNLRREVFVPVLSLFSPVTPSPLARSGEGIAPPRLSFDPILARASEEARRRGWPQPASEIFYAAGAGLYGVAFGDRNDPLNRPWLYFDGASGALAGEVVFGAGTFGDAVLQVQHPIHSGRIAGLFGRMVVAVAGLAIALLSLTGIFVWAMKRKGRRAHRAAR